MVVVADLLLAASAIAGAAWQWLGPEATFRIGAGFAALSLLGLAATAVFRSGAATPRPGDGR